MTKTITDFVLDGLVSKETDLPIRLRRASPDQQADFDIDIVQPIIQQESGSSLARAISVRSYVEAMVACSMPDLFGADFDLLERFFIAEPPAGASVPVETADALTEDHRLENRRVQSRLIHFVSD